MLMVGVVSPEHWHEIRITKISSEGLSGYSVKFRTSENFPLPYIIQNYSCLSVCPSVMEGQRVG